MIYWCVYNLILEDENILESTLLFAWQWKFSFCFWYQFLTLSIGKCRNYAWIWLDPENDPKLRGCHKGITHCAWVKPRSHVREMSKFPVMAGHMCLTLHLQNWCPDLGWLCIAWSKIKPTLFVQAGTVCWLNSVILECKLTCTKEMIHL